MTGKVSPSLGPRGLSRTGSPLSGPLRPAPVQGRFPPLHRRRASADIRTITKALLAAAPAAGVEVPLDFYKILQVSHVASRDTASRAYDRCMANPPRVGYSDSTLQARGSILQGALETLLDPVARKDYDERLMLGDVVEEVPPEYVPGVLAVLQESGEAAAVVAAGQQWLDAHRRDRAAGDVAIAVALARCDLAHAALEGQGDVVQAVAHMEAAAAQLRQYQPGSELQHDVEGAVLELQPQLALGLLALPLGEAPGQRSRGLALAESVLRGPATRERGLAGPAARAEFLKQLAGCLTAAEQVRLYEVCGAEYSDNPVELYDVALAYIAEGAAALRPSHLQKAAALLLQPAGLPLDVSEANREKRAAEERNRRAVALSVCHLLLGRAEEAEAALGLEPGAVLKCDRAVLQFIKSNSPDKEDLLPGLCVLAQRWVHDVAFSSFRLAQDIPFSLDAWFAAAQVQRAIKLCEVYADAPSPALVQALERGGDIEAGNPLGEALTKATALLSAPFVSGLAVALSLVGLLDSGNSSSSSSSRAQGQQSHQPGAAPSRQAGWAEQQPQYAGAAAAVHVTAAPHSHSHTPAYTNGHSHSSSNGNGNGSVPEVVAAAPMIRMDDGYLNGNGSSNGASASSSSNGAANGWDGESQPAAALNGNGSGAAYAAKAAAESAPAGFDLDDEDMGEFASQPVERPLPLAGEELMVEAYQARYVRWGRIVGTLAAVAGGILLGRLAFMRTSGALARPPPQPMAVVAAVAGPQAAVGRGAAVREVDAGVQVVPLSKQEAASVISQWQQIKSDALGPQHLTSKLEKILTGPMLSQWQDRTADIKERGCYVVQSMERCNIDSVGMGSTPGSVAVAASLKESTQVHTGEGEPEVLRSEYTVSYELVQEKGQWKISAAEVQH